MLVESSIKEVCENTTTQPITDTEEIIKIICEWNGIIIDEFRQVVWPYKLIGTDSDNKYIYTLDDCIINPIGVYLTKSYNWKTVVFEKWNDKFFGKLKVRDETTRYQLWDKVIEIPFRIRAENEDTGEWIIIFPKRNDIVQGRMRSLYVVNTGRAERQKIEKEIMAKLIELAKVKGWNEIVSTQNMIEELKETLKQRGIDLDLGERGNWVITVFLPRRKIRDVAWADRDYVAPPIRIAINFDARTVQCLWYSPHWFGTPTTWWNPCWWTWDDDIRRCLENCSVKELINLVISWWYGYNSNDTHLEHTDRHPLAKLRDYIWYVYDHKNGIEQEEKDLITKNYNEIKSDLEIDGWLDNNENVKEFLSTLEKTDENSR